MVNESQQVINPVLQLNHGRPVSSPPNTSVVKEILRPQYLEVEPGPSTPLATGLYTQPEIQDDTRGRSLSAVRPYSPSNIEPARSGQTTLCRARAQRSRQERRKLRPRATDVAAQNFLKAEDFWRKFKVEQHRDYMFLQKEQNRIRELELQTQREWQTLGLQLVGLLEKVVNKICNN